DAQRRVITCQVDDVVLVNAYVVNGERVGSEKYAFKLGWIQRFAAYLATLDLREKVVVAGDFNITFDDRDVHDPEAWREKILCSTPERDALRELMKPGFVDAFRHFNAEGGHYTWWDFVTRAFQGNRGLRIDHILMSPAALAACREIVIDKGFRGG